MGAGPYCFEHENGGSLFLRNTGVKYIHIGVRAQKATLWPIRAVKTSKSDTCTVCFLAAVVLLTKRL
jgi:hypothetical protein